MVNIDHLLTGAHTLGLVLADTQLDQFANYQRLIQEWNRRMNLTAVTDGVAIQERHFLDSLTCVIATGDLNGQTLIDVGSGAGFPGIPLKICFPELKLTLLESTKKKTRFLHAVVEMLKLDTVVIIGTRAEELGHLPEHREFYDWAVARAVAPLRTLSEYLLPLTRIHGNALAQKGKDAPRELREANEALHVLGGGETELIPVHSAGKEESSYLVKVQKEIVTPDKYPRRSGVPAKRPL